MGDPITTGICFSITPENRKPLGFLMFSGGIDKQLELSWRM